MKGEDHLENFGTYRVIIRQWEHADGLIWVMVKDEQ
jgi:hypothetical protein